MRKYLRPVVMWLAWFTIFAGGYIAHPGLGLAVMGVFMLIWAVEKL